MTPAPKSVETFMIFPTQKYNRPPPPSAIKLSALDLSPPIHILNHRYYHLSNVASLNATADLVNKLKSSLAEALELYPPVAGTVRVQKNGELHIAMDAKSVMGTPFLVETKSVQYTGDTEEVSPRTVMLLPPESSTLAVKVTQVSWHIDTFFLWNRRRSFFAAPPSR
ncbi:hypothetical protein BYT27DRAFT_7198362 [Phlegmacium glaucopus]|nr:hypothetical protein BYT27DRAFT_7198362 [Phlegmacium glaucopus]